jgi:hypothetical protein
MAQDLTVNIKTTSDVPQAMDKAKSATVSFGKQVEDIQKKFSTAFKDIALSFVAPIVLLNSAINYIGAAIEKRKADIKEAYDFALKAESKYLSAEAIYLAKQRNARETDAKEKELAAKAETEEFTKLLEQEGMRDKVAREIGGFRGFRIFAGLDANSAEALAKDEDVKEVLRKMLAPALAEDAEKEPPKDTTARSANFSGPEGFGNVIGVGANPVIEAMNAQYEELQKQTQLLSDIRDFYGVSLPPDFTKTPTT